MPKNRKLVLGGLALATVVGLGIAMPKEMGASDSGFIDTPVAEQNVEVSMEDDVVEEEVVEEEVPVTEEEKVVEEVKEEEQKEEVKEENTSKDPVIKIAQSRSGYKVGSNPDWSEGVTVTDGAKLDIDASEVQMSKKGTYKVIYRAYNSNGGFTTEVREITVG